MNDDTFLAVETIHYIPDPCKPFDPALCGIRWVEGSDDVSDVTCPECKRMLAKVIKVEKK